MYDRRNLIAAEPVKRQLGHNGMAAKAVLEGGPGGHEHHDSCTGDLVETEIDKFKCRRIDPMRVSEHEQDGLTARQLHELVDERLQCASPLLLRRQAQSSI